MARLTDDEKSEKSQWETKCSPTLIYSLPVDMSPPANNSQSHYCFSFFIKKKEKQLGPGTQTNLQESGYSISLIKSACIVPYEIKAYAISSGI